MSASDQRVLQRTKLATAPMLLLRCCRCHHCTVAMLLPLPPSPLPLFSLSLLSLSLLPLPSLLPLLLFVDC
jgi:hypothetical protein